MAQQTLDMPAWATADQIQLLQAIQAGQDENDVELSLVLNDMNKGVASLVAKNGKILRNIQSDVLKKLGQQLVDNDNTIDQVSTAMLAWTQSELDDAKLLLTQLAASAGLTNPGDPLEAALTTQLAEVPDMAYSATLLLAIRDAMPVLARIAVAIEKIADIPARTRTERVAADESADDESEFDPFATIPDDLEL